MSIFVATDHRGFKMKEELKSWLKSLGHGVADVGNDEYDQTDDFPDFVVPAAKKTVKNATNKAIVFCGSGAGASIAANKIKGARASIGINKEQVEAATADDDINILVIAADYTGINLAKEMITAFLSTQFKAEERHLRRLKKIADLETLL